MGEVTLFRGWDLLCPQIYPQKEDKSFTVLEHWKGVAGLTVGALREETWPFIFLCLVLAIPCAGYVMAYLPSCHPMFCHCAWIICLGVFWCLVFLTHSFCSSGNKMMPWCHGHLCFCAEILSGFCTMTASSTSPLASNCHRELFSSNSSSRKMLLLPTSCRQGGFGGLLRNCASPVSDWWLTHEKISFMSER